MLRIMRFACTFSQTKKIDQKPASQYLHGAFAYWLAAQKCLQRIRVTKALPLGCQGFYLFLFNRIFLLTNCLPACLIDAFRQV